MIETFEGVNDALHVLPRAMKGAHLCDMGTSMVGQMIAWSRRHIELDGCR